MATSPARHQVVPPPPPPLALPTGPFGLRTPPVLSRTEKKKRVVAAADSYALALRAEADASRAVLDAERSLAQVAALLHPLSPAQVAVRHERHS